jgi:hypothetical protein
LGLYWVGGDHAQFSPKWQAARKTPDPNGPVNKLINQAKPPHKSLEKLDLGA